MEIVLLRGSSSFGRARPCQGRGGRFEPGLPLQDPPGHSGGFFLGKKVHGFSRLINGLNLKP